MAVIKSGKLEHEAHTLSTVAFNLNDVSDKAQSDLNNVKLKAADIIKQAQEQAKQIRAKAEAEGRQAAEQRARQSLKAEVDQHAATLLPALRTLVQDLTTERQNWLNQWEKIGLQVAVAIAEKVVRRELASDPQISASLVRESLQLASGCGEIHIRLNPQDLSSMQSGEAMLCDELKKLASTQIIADPAISRGGCIVETPFGAIDNRIETQLSRIADELGGAT
ncbi:FliH/SctL family protein [Bremerella sp. P1]|uniref:FliH/SctL family protein n=1 Tax=Bremerella sp. P1 TaxID=3026424 RepID=UPI0023682930|nr:FliH/SctL family protein [Bremerella sp. P1]WDI43044.1 FliH/SctL family protein [Bremerella sp. P1]